MFGLMYQCTKLLQDLTVLVYHHTSSLLCGKILTTHIVLLLEYGFITDARLEAKKKKTHTQKVVI